MLVLLHALIVIAAELHFKSLSIIRILRLCKLVKGKQDLESNEVISY